MSQQFTPGLFERLSGDGAAAWSLEQLKDAVARDLEALLNTRMALAGQMLAAYPEVGNSLLNYGLLDFASMCLASEADRSSICAAVKRSIERHEPRLRDVGAALRLHGAGSNRVDFVISALLRVGRVVGPVHFDAVLEPSSQQYSIREVRQRHREGGA
ncbi:type VI secretion system baseplate subunit TssE [Janthinobacterium fluminis]|uniref:Type VI secretion system baseplate subunit TssE n=1 Tax=Janthinobacterium fluminis TaxID=2987524 RepID=A0ABT5JY20_9BURK|nr:type VI secretion system baseplate subunit TssE [Janthinobacterium fluminis]MDC8757075.1 type VI secretion system baseplate subunit TssE [Janthinobacterium fluminis]